MICNKIKKRSFFNLFEIFSCASCNKDYIYNYIYVGNNTINVYELNNECINDIKKQKMIKLFLKERIINDNEKNLYFIMNKYEYNSIFIYLPLLMEDNNIYILVT